eukprot:1146189-Pyramimonas_sp.AAC.1
MRTWGRATKTPMAEWRDMRAAHLDAAVRGSRARQAALPTAVLDEARARVGLDGQGDFLAGVEKFH